MEVGDMVKVIAGKPVGKPGVTIEGFEFAPTLYTVKYDGNSKPEAKDEMLREVIEPK